jgi:hypothetical protein
MSNHHWACFTCRTVTRRPSMSTNVRCRECRAPCESLGYKTPIPPRYKTQEWEALFRYVNDERRARLESQRQFKRRSRHDLEKRIDRMERLPASKGRVESIKVLRKRLELL